MCILLATINYQAPPATSSAPRQAMQATLNLVNYPLEREGCDPGEQVVN